MNINFSNLNSQQAKFVACAENLRKQVPFFIITEFSQMDFQ